MVDSPRDPGTRDAPGTPRWVKALGVSIVVVVLLVIVVMLIVGGEHGPGRHTASSGNDAQTPAASGPVIGGSVGGPVDAEEAAPTVEVTTLDMMAFEPITVR